MNSKSIAIAFELVSSEEHNDRISEEAGLKILNLIGPSSDTDDLIHTLAGYKLAVLLMKKQLEAAKSKKSLFRRMIDKIK